MVLFSANLFIALSIKYRNTAMSVHVKYFASLRETIGRSSDEISITGPATVEEIWQQTTSGMQRPERVLAAINQEYADFAQVVNDGDEVAFFPPVTGG